MSRVTCFPGNPTNPHDFAAGLRVDLAGLRPDLARRSDNRRFRWLFKVRRWGWR